MKKSQILAALALAFALGVVAPVAGANAAMVKINERGALVIDKEETKKMNDAIQEGKESCGWHLVGTGIDATMTYYYDQFLALDHAIEVANNVIKAEKEYLFNNGKANQYVDGSNADLGTFTANYASLTYAYNTFIDTLSTNLTTYFNTTLADSIEAVMPSSVTDYDEAVKFINDTNIELTNLSNRYNQESTKNISANYRATVVKLNDALKAAADELEAVEEIQSDSTVQPAIIAITEAENIDTKMTLAQAINYANSLNTNDHGTCNIARALNIKKAVEYAEGLIKSQNSFWAAEGEKAIENIKKAMNGGTVTNDDVKEPTPADDDKKAPNTGILSDAEGGASTTVAVVAGAATALTAAGAGVVAYRNARRSSRK